MTNPGVRTTPTSLTEAIRYFSDAKRCLDYVVSRRWPNGVTCSTCGNRKVHFLANQLRWKCSAKHAKRQFSAKVGTIFEESPVGFAKWLPAMWLIANCKNGISSYELADHIKVTQRTGWFMLHRIRLAMQTSGGKLGGPGTTTEVDETFIGGKARNMHRDRRVKNLGRGIRGIAGKVIVMGMLQRGGRIRAHVVSDTSRHTLQSTIRDTVVPGSEIHSDELPS